MCMSKGQGAACESRVMFILDQSEKSVVCPWFRPPLTPPNLEISHTIMQNMYIQRKRLCLYALQIQ